VFHINLLSRIHGFRHNEVLMKVGYDVIVIMIIIIIINIIVDDNLLYAVLKNIKYLVISR